MKSTILLTGATGFIGRRILDLLLRQDVNIVIVVRNQSSKCLPKLRLQDKIIYTDNIFSETESWWEKLFFNVDIVLHLAWFAEHDSYMDSPINEECLRGSISMAVGAIKAGVKKIVGIGTCLEYQISDEGLSIDTPLAPQSAYAKSKAELYYFLSEYSSRYPFMFTWCRIFFIYGDDEPAAKLHSYIRGELIAGRKVILKYGDAKRDYLHVDLVAKRIIDLTFGERGGVFNICSGQSVKIKEVAYQIADDIGADRSLIVSEGAVHEFKQIQGVPNFI